MCQEEADLEPKLRKAGSPPRSLGLGDTQLTCLSPPKLFVVEVSQVVCGLQSLGFWQDHHKKVTCRGPNIAALQAWSSTQRKLSGAPTLQPRLWWHLRLPP